MGQTHLRRRPWLKPSPQSSSPAMSKLSCYSSSWWQWGKKCSCSSPNHLQRLHGHSSATLHRGRIASRGRSLLTSCDQVQVWAPKLHGGVEDSLYRAATAQRCQCVVGQLHRHSPCGVPGVMGQVLQHLPRPLHSSRRDEEKVPRVHGPKPRWKVCA
jgi:hypothetical protein